MTTLTRWLVPALMATALGFGAMTPAPAHAQDSLTRVLVDIADVVFNNGTPYYRGGDYGYNDRLIVSTDRYGRPVYYRQVPAGYNSGYNTGGYNQRVVYDQYGRRIFDQYGRRIDYGNYRNGNRSGPPYGNAYGYYRNGPGSNRMQCNKHGKCKGYDGRYGNRDRDDHDHDRRWHDDD